MDGPVIVAADISRKYGERPALDGFSLEVPTGSVFGLLGPNGSGKSTFVGLIAAMELPERGRLAVFGETPRTSLRSRVGTVFQENTSDPLMTLDDTLQLAGRLFGAGRKRSHERSAQLLTAFGLADRAGSPVRSLSGGMRRRLEMSRALLHDPELLLLDEPTTGVDPHERRALWQALVEQRTGRRTILLATNDLAEADTVCDRVAFIQEGRVIAAGTPAELKRGLKREAVVITWASPEPRYRAAVAAIAGEDCVSGAADVLHVTVDDAAAFVPRLFEAAPGAIRSVSIETSSLEDAYFQHFSGRPAAPETAE